MRSLVMYFFLLVLQVYFYFTSDVVYKYGRFSRTLLKECLEFILYKESDPVLLSLGFVLLPIKVDSISKKQGCKRDFLVAYYTGCVKIIFAFLTKVNLLALTIQVKVMGLKTFLLGGRVYLAIFLVFDK